MLDASSEVELGAGPTRTLSIGLTDPVRNEPSLGVNTAVSCAVEAANAVEQSAVTLCAVGETGTSPHVPIVAPPFSNATVPAGNGAPIAELTVAVKVTVSFVTAVPGEACSTVAVAFEPGRMSGAVVSACAVPVSAKQPNAVADTTSWAIRGAHLTKQRLRRRFPPTQCLIPRKTVPNVRSGAKQMISRAPRPANPPTTGSSEQDWSLGWLSRCSVAPPQRLLRRGVGTRANC